jgi:anti-anti-sigma factor
MDEIEVTHPGESVAVIALHGEHDLLTREEIAALLAGEVLGNDLVVVDVSDAKFVDASFLHNLAIADRAASGRGSRFVLQMGTADIVRRALEVSGLLESLKVAHSRQEAVLELAPD